MNKTDTAGLLESESSTMDENSEIFSLIWLDSSVDDNVNKLVQGKLRASINHLKKFTEVDDCQQYIKQRPESDRLAIIVTGRFGREIVPKIHQLRQISSIYIFCMNKQAYEKWASDFSKVKLFCRVSYR